MQNIPVAAPLDVDFAGRGAERALASVVRVVNRLAGSTGTGFLHYSGRILTTEQVVRGAGPADIVLRTSGEATVAARAIHADPRVGLALVEPAAPFENIPTLPLSSPSTLTIGRLLSSWGYPSDYLGLRPLLTIGYLAGTETAGGVTRYVLNAAFNSGNSGAPLVRLETGDVIGIVTIEPAPLPPQVQSVLAALARRQSGSQETSTPPDASPSPVDEQQVISQVRQFLRSETRPVVGRAVILEDLRSFLEAQALSP